MYHGGFLGYLVRVPSQPYYVHTDDNNESLQGIAGMTCIIIPIHVSYTTS